MNCQQKPGNAASSATRNGLIASSKQASFLTRTLKDYHAYPARCTKTGRKCDGYSQLKHDYQTQIISYALGPSRGPRAAISLSSTYDNVHYLKFYYYHVGPMLSGRFDTEFWCGIVLQMAHAEPTVRNAMIALAHLNQHQCGSLAQARQFPATNNTESGRQFGLYYNKAIRCLVVRMTEASYAPETGLVTCLLFACIEFLRAEMQNALLHMRNGLYIVSELRRKHGISASSSLPDTVLRPNGVSGPLNMIERTLVPVFTQGLISALLYGVDVDTEFAFLHPTPLKHVHTQAFTSLREARLVYCEIRNASILLARDMAIKIFQGLEPSTSDLERQTYILSCHQTWLKGLLAFQENTRDMSEDDELAISALKLGYHATYTATACAHDACQMSFDTHLDSFEAIIYHATLLINNTMDIATRTQTQRSHTGAAANFTFDTLLVPALYYTALRCRHPVTRREAIALLSRKLAREGLWDPEQYRIVAERVVEIEEKEVDERGWPVERTRLWSGTATADADEESGFRADFLFAKDVGRGVAGMWSGWYGLDGKERKGVSVGELYVEVPVQRCSDSS